MQMKSLLLPVFLGLLAAVVAAGGACPKYEKEVRNSQNAVKCVPDTGSCAGSPNFVQIACFVSPCFSLPKDECPTVAHCFADACNACRPRYYDALFNEVCRRP
ncbi:hypothetical protein M3Y99_00746600 [Aphelenchoides fujianensis]|nr:hypothetical protein M3Y99_00746600 [Aphelenchoides fujianensis]